MGNIIKYGGTSDNSIKSGGFNVAVNGNNLNTSTFYNGISPVIGGYTIYVDKASNGPAIYAPKNDSELVTISQALGGIPTTNLLADSGISIYNNVWGDVNSALVATSETYKGATVWKQTLTPLTANGVSWLSNGNNPGIGTVIWGAGGGLANRFTGHSIFFKPTVPMNGVPIYTNYSNIPGYQSSTNYDDMGDGWFRANVIWYDTVTRSDGKFWAINPLSSTLNTPIDIYWAGPFKEDRNDSLVVASFVNGTRGTTSTDALVWLNYQTNMTVVNSNYPSIVTDGLVLNLDAGFVSSYPRTGTSWKDLSGNGNNSTLVNGPSYNSSANGNISFDGADDYATTFTTPASLQGDPNFTVCAWMRRTGDGGGNTGTWGLSGDGNGINSWWSNNNNEITIDTWGQATFTTGVTYPLNEWVFVAWQKIAGNMTRANCILWRNLVSYTGTQLTVLRPEAGPPNIGNNGINIGRISQNYSTPVPMQVASFSVYNRVLSPAEIQQNYYAGLQKLIPTDGLVLSLDAQNTNLYAISPTTAYDISSNDNNGSILNGTQYTERGNGSWIFDGADDEILIENSSSINFNGVQQYTVLAWVYPNLGGTTWHGIVSKGESQQYALTINSPNAYLHYETNQGGIGPLNSSANSVDLNQWQLVGIRFDGTEKTIWKNGTSIASQAASSLNSASNTEQLRIGEGNSGEQFRGNISQVEIYNRALTSTEISTIYNATKSRYGL